ncbi:hypothetical protein [Luteolibacter marinus]|uniref:hypothetical protein n=1 Tax=Luteolibacter marinus TaxID=2776705 RepID=UPI0018685799|nr:hypothetical protein [Luteolibacter marinus]
MRVGIAISQTFATEMKMFGHSFAVIALVASTALAADVPKDPEKMAGYFLRQMTRLEFEGVEAHTSLVDAQRYKALHVQAARLAEKAGAKQYFEHLVTWADSADEIELMQPREVYGAFIRSLFEMQRTKFPDLYASLVKQGEASKIEIIGHTMNGPDAMLVNYRVSGTVEGQSFTKVEVLPLRREDGSWVLGIQDANFTKINETIGQLEKLIGEQDAALKDQR